MDENVLMRYVAGEASREERERVMDWVEESEENRGRFCRLKNAWVMTHLPQGRVKGGGVPWRRGGRRGWGRRVWIGYGVAASVAVLLAVGWMREERQHVAEVAFLKGQGMGEMVYRTDRGVKGEVRLPDGSRVWLNSGSELRCPGRFAGGVREVEFEGEGFFDVVKDAEHPMVVRLGSGLRVVVRGTRFNLSSYGDDDYVTALLVEGRITVEREGMRGEVEVRPQERVRVLKAEREKPATVSVPEVTFPILGWKEGWLVFDETPVREVVKRLERWHGVELKVEDEELLERRFTARFKEESVQQVLEMMERVALLRYEWVDSTAHLYSYR